MSWNTYPKSRLHPYKGVAANLVAAITDKNTRQQVRDRERHLQYVIVRNRYQLPRRIIRAIARSIVVRDWKAKHAH